MWTDRWKSSMSQLDANPFTCNERVIISCVDKIAKSNFTINQKIRNQHCFVLLIVRIKIGVNFETKNGIMLIIFFEKNYPLFTPICFVVEDGWSCRSIWKQLPKILNCFMFFLKKNLTHISKHNFCIFTTIKLFRANVANSKCFITG